MRGTRAAALACLGAWGACSFKSPGPGAGGNGDSTAPDAGPAEPDAPPPPPCMADATYQPDATTGHRYKVLTQSVNYDTAIDQCAADGAHLAVVDSAAENTLLSSILMATGGGNEAWIGFDDLTVEGTFQWVTGATGVNLYKGAEPNNTGNEDCTGFRPDGVWHDFGCEGPKRPLCECDPTYRPPPTPPCRTMATDSFEKSGRRVFRGPAATWDAAKAACAAIGAHLLVIGDQGENDEMNQSLNGNAYWIGYTDAVQEGAFVWVNGAASTYHRFSGGTVPNDTDDDCVALQDDGGGTWDDSECDAMKPYACECDPLPP